MNTKTALGPIDPIEAVILAAWLAVEAVAVLLRLALVPAVALLLTILRAGDGRSPDRVMTAEPLEVRLEPSPWCPPPWLSELEALPVAELRRLARSAGLPRCLSSRGRRAELLLALAVPPMA